MLKRKFPVQQPVQKAVSPQGRWRRKVFTGTLLATLVLLALLLPQVPSGPLPGGTAHAVVQTPAMAFGEPATVGGCLRLTVQSYRDHSGDVENYDWVTVILQNECPHAVGGLLVELYLVSVNGELYGRRFWALDPDQMLIPSSTRKDRFAIPDPDSYSAGAWAARILEAKKKQPR